MERDRFESICGLANQVHVRFTVDRPSDALANDWMVVDAEHAYEVSSVHGSVVLKSLRNTLDWSYHTARYSPEKHLESLDPVLTFGLPIGDCCRYA
jgi:hypothetical protein